VVDTATSICPQTSPPTLIERIREYDPFHQRNIMQLDASVNNYWQSTLGGRLSSGLHLMLELQPTGVFADSISEYSKLYSPLGLRLDSHLVRETYEMLKQGKKAQFNGRLIVNTDWFVLPPGNVFTGNLVGRLSVDGNSYDVGFYAQLGSGWGPRLQYIRKVQ